MLYNRLPARHPKLLFKGGTSLSKAFGLIRRFSEDIDLVVYRDDLGFEKERDPTHHNLLCLGVVHQRVSIPIESVALGRAGTSSMADQMDLLDRALAYLPAARCCLLADREFIGGAWLRHLRQQPVDFVIRVRANHRMERADGRILSLERTTRNQPKNTTRVYEQVHLYEGANAVPVHLICHRPRKVRRVRFPIHQAHQH